MIEENLILTKINRLPEELQQEVLHYIEFLHERYAAQNENYQPHKRQAGSAKGKYKIAPDFDTPLEDFRDYM